MNARRACVHVVLPLLIGALAYVGWRRMTIPLFAGLEAVGAAPFVVWWRDLLLPVRTAVPEWFVHSMPASCWAYAFCATMAATWAGAPSRWRTSAAVAAVVLVAAGEIAQALPGVPGVFDSTDLVSDVGAGALGTALARRPGGQR